MRLFGADRAGSIMMAGYVPQRPALASEVPATVEEIVTSGDCPQRLVATPSRRTGTPSAMPSDRWPGTSGRPAGRGALRRAAAGARSSRAPFASEPDLLVLGEAVAGVDAESSTGSAFVDAPDRRARCGVPLVSHELSAVAGEVDRVIVLKAGSLFDGTQPNSRAKGCPGHPPRGPACGSRVSDDRARAAASVRAAVHAARSPPGAVVGVFAPMIGIFLVQKRLLGG